jgi:hypothetical protein
MEMKWILALSWIFIAAIIFGIPIVRRKNRGTPRPYVVLNAVIMVIIYGCAGLGLIFLLFR